MIDLTLAEIAQALGGDIHRGYDLAPGPGHSYCDRSLEVWIDESGRVCCTTYSTDSWTVCMDHVRARLALPAFTPDKREAKHKDRRSPEERLAEAIALWKSTAVDHRADAALANRWWSRAVDPGGTSSVDYLKGRDLDLDEGMAGRLVRHLESCPRGPGNKQAALVVRFAPIVHPTGTTPWGEDPPVTCIQRIFLDPSKPKGHSGKWLMGHPFDLPMPELRDGQVHVPPSRPMLAMKLSADEEVEQALYLAEGFESGLAAMHFGFRPLWAVYSAKAIELFPIFGGISALTVMADHDRPKNGQADGAGQLAAKSCRDRWSRAWCEQPFMKSDRRFAVLVDEVAIHVAQTAGDDWVDAWARYCSNVKA